MTNDKRVEEIRERLAKIGPTPWKVTPKEDDTWGIRSPEPFNGGADGMIFMAMWYGHPVEKTDEADALTWANCNLAAHAPSDLDFLLSELDRARKVVERIAALNPEDDSDDGWNEWGEADCYRQAVKIAKEYAAYDAPTENK